MTVADTIVKLAQSYLGQEEIQPNKGFKDPDFDHKMRTMTPFENGNPWCADLKILVWREAYAPYPELLSWYNKLCVANSQQMLRNFHNDPVWPTSKTEPKIGAAVIFGDVGSTVYGHTACAIISISADGKYYTTVEGNTRPSGNPGNVAEGYIVATHTHLVGAPHPITGLEFLGFIYVIEPGTLTEQ